MALRPFDVTKEQPIGETFTPEVPDELAQILADTGLGKPVDKSEKNAKLADVRSIFKKHGAGIEDAAITVARNLHAEKEADQLKAANMILQVNGILDAMDEKHATQVSIVINNLPGSESKTLVNLVCPTS